MVEKRKRRMGPKMVSRTRSDAYAAFARHDGASDATIAAELRISRQRVSILRRDWKVAVGNGKEAETDETIAPIDLAAGHASAPQPAMSGNAIERQRLLDLASDDLQLEVLVDKILRGSAPRAAALAVGMSGKVFAKRLETDATFRDLVLRAAHEAESSVAQNLYRLAIGNSPQAAQSAIAWLNARVPDDWSPNRQKIDIEVSGGVDVMAILASPRLIELESQMEAERQRLEEAQRLELPAPKGDVIDLEPIEIRNVPPLPDIVLDESGPEPVRAIRVPVSKSHRVTMVDGIPTEHVDERASGDDDRPPF
jgi:hypothetical protein